MKKIYLILVLTTFLSCNSDDNTELSTIELITQNSPWSFDHYEMLNIVNSGSSNITQQEIETDINSSLLNLTLTFNTDGSGFASFPNEPNENWQWEIMPNNQLKLTYDISNQDYELFYNLNVTESHMIMEMESVTYDSDANYEVSHYGKYHFD
jgi:hypothetical protein